MSYVRTLGGHKLAVQLDAFTSSSLLPGSGIDVKITDLTNQTFHAAQYLGPQLTTPAANSFAFHLSRQSASGGNGQDHLHIELDGYILDLLARSVGPIALDFDRGLWQIDAADYYHSYDRLLMDVSGSLTLRGQTTQVTGFADYGKFWGPSVAVERVSWQFMYFRLSDGRLVQLWQVRPSRGQPPQWWTGAVVDHDCRVRHLGRGDFTITSTGSWTRADGSCTYPSGWTVEVLGRKFSITPEVLDQEIRGFPLTHWRGAVRVTGAAPGQGFVELLGYCSS